MDNLRKDWLSENRCIVKSFASEFFVVDMFALQAVGIDPGPRAADIGYATMQGEVGSRDWVANIGHMRLSAELDHMHTYAEVDPGRRAGKQVVGETFQENTVAAD